MLSWFKVTTTTIKHSDGIQNIVKVSPQLHAKPTKYCRWAFRLYHIFNHKIPWARTSHRFFSFNNVKSFFIPFFLLHLKITLTPKNIPPCTKALNKTKAVRKFLCDFSPVDFINKMNINYSIFHLRSHVLKPETHSLAAAFSSLALFFSSYLHKAVSWEGEREGGLLLNWDCVLLTGIFFFQSK